MALTRRRFLGVSAAGAAFALVGLRRRSARGDGPARAKRLLVLVAEGGMRTTMAFNASSRVELNPWGVIAGPGALRLGRVLMEAPTSVAYAAPSWSGAPTVPDITQAARLMSVLQGLDHAPGQFRAGDHSDDGSRMGTGWFGKDGAPGLITVLSKFLSDHAPAPVVTVGSLGSTGLPMAAAAGEWLPFAPVQLQAANMPLPQMGGAGTIGRPIEDALDARARARRRGLPRALVEAYLGVKGAMRQYGPLLSQPALNFADPTNYGAAVGGISNRMLLEAVGNLVTPTDPGFNDGLSVALGLRMLQVGSPAVMVCVGDGNFDTHSSEREIAPDLYTRFGRYLAGIHFALGHMPDGGATMLSSTLVVTASEFGRTTGGSGGYPDRDGTDHGGDDPAWRSQAHVFFGAGTSPKALAPTDDSNLPQGPVHSSQALLATLCSALGVPQPEIDALWPPGNPSYPEGSPMLEMWA